jgi:hypothetical protein
MKKNNLNPKSIVVPIVSGSICTILNKTAFKSFNPALKHGGGILLGTALSIFSKNKIIKQAGVGLIISNSADLISSTTQKNNCPFEFENHIPGPNTLLININSGRIIPKNQNEGGVIYLTNKNNYEGWTNSFMLKHCLNISGKFGGLPSKKGSPVLWSNLQNHTKDFNNLLLNWVAFFENKKIEFDENPTDYFYKLWYFRSLFNDGKLLDIKKTDWSPSMKGEWSKFNNTLVRYDDYGNILYGAAGSAFGLDESILLAAANLNQLKKTGFDDEKDLYSIKRGITIYKNYFNHLQKIA